MTEALRQQIQKPTEIDQSLLTDIRAATREPHLRLHVHPLTGALIKSDLSHEQYLLVLQAFQRFYQSIERKFYTPSKLFQSEDYCRLLEADLAVLSDGFNPLPECPDLVSPIDIDSYLGTMYVIEGSNLGGQVISKNV